VIEPGFVHGNQSRQEIIWIALNKKIPKVAQTTGIVFGRPGRGALQVEKSARLNWATQL
jgi:hypothetical protein